MTPTVQLLEQEEIIDAITELNKIYPYIPSLVLWRAWEYAAYCKHSLRDPILDLACGDGKFFNIIWKKANHVIGIDIDQQVCERARASGVYTEVHQVSAHNLPFTDGSFAGVFSNCALEHMDYIDRVLSETFRVIQDGGLFVASVVTNKIVEWEMLPSISLKLDLKDWGQKMKSDFENFHHLRNTFSTEEWIERVEKTGFNVKCYYPIVPEPYARIFMLFDEFWHINYKEMEIGHELYKYLSQLPNYSEGMKEIASGLLKLSKSPGVGAGLVFVAEK